MSLRRHLPISRRHFSSCSFFGILPNTSISMASGRSTFRAAKCPVDKWVTVSQTPPWLNSIKEQKDNENHS